MNSSPFRLLPWEHGGVIPAPSRTIEARVEGELQRFEVKWRDGRAFFRLAGEMDHRVWASWNCISENEFADAVEAGEIGRYFVVRRGFSTRTVSAEFASQVKPRMGSYDLLGPTSLAVIVNDEYRGRAQEWCGGSWLDFALPPRRDIQSGARKPSLWHRGWNVAGMRGALAVLAGEVAFRAFEPNIADDQELRFASGSLEQLQRLYHAASLVCAPRQIERNPWLSRYLANSYGARNSGARKQTQSVVAESPQNRAKASHNYLAPEPLLAAFLRHNLPVGGSWRCLRPQTEAVQRPLQKISRFLARKNSLPSVAPPTPKLQRVDYSFGARMVHFDFEVKLEASAHEQLEARLFLRDWMRENLPPAQYEKLRKTLEARF